MPTGDEEDADAHPVVLRLPDKPLSISAVRTLGEYDDVAQAVAVRGYGAGSDRAAIQLLVNINAERLVALHYEFEARQWQRVYDSRESDGSVENADAGEHPEYEHAHAVLTEYAPDMDARFDAHFENRLP